MAEAASNGVVTLKSRHSVDETVGKIQTFLDSNGVKVFAVIDHSGEAEKAGLKMPPTKVVIFGSPKRGTPLMLASPEVALDLPLKILVAEDAAGAVRISYDSPQWLAARHSVPAELVPNIAVIEMIAAKAAE
jgi:uncharacterized protein (DUF302 family)